MQTKTLKLCFHQKPKCDQQKWGLLLHSYGHLSHHQMSASDLHYPHFLCCSYPKGEKDRYFTLWQGDQRVGCTNDAKLYGLHTNNYMPNLTSLPLSPLQLLIILHSLLLALCTKTTVDTRELDTTTKLEADIKLWLSNQKTKIFPSSSILGDFQSTVICVPWKWLHVLGFKPPVK